MRTSINLEEIEVDDTTFEVLEQTENDIYREIKKLSISPGKLRTDRFIRNMDGVEHLWKFYRELKAKNFSVKVNPVSINLGTDEDTGSELLFVGEGGVTLIYKRKGNRWILDGKIVD